MRPRCRLSGWRYIAERHTGRRRGGGHGAANTFDLQHGFGELARGGIRDFGGEQLGEAALHFVQRGCFGFAEAEKLTVAAADDGHEFLLVAGVGFADEHDDFAPVNRLGRGFGFVELFFRFGKLGPHFKRHDDGGRRVGDAHQTSVGREVVFCAVVGK